MNLLVIKNKSFYIKAAALLFLLLLIQSNLYSLVIYFRSVNKLNHTRFVFEGSQKFKYNFNKLQKNFEFTVFGDIEEFKIGSDIQKSIFVKTINYKINVKKQYCKIIVDLTDQFDVKNIKILTNPFRVNINLIHSNKKITKNKTISTNKLNMILNAYGYLFRPPEFFSASLKAIGDIINLKSLRPSVNDTKDNITKEQYNILKNEIGFKFIADYAYNTDLGINEVDEGPYKWRIRAGFDWDFLRDGLIKRIKQKKILKNNIRINEQLSIKRKRKENYSLLHNIIIFLFSDKKLENLKKREKILKELKFLYLEEYFRNEGSEEELLRVNRDIHIVDNMLDNYSSYKKGMITHENLDKLKIESADKLPIVDIDMDSLYRDLNYPVSTELLFLNKNKEMNLKYNYLKDVRLKFWLYYYHYNRGRLDSNIYDTKTNDFFSLGVQVNIPFPLNLKNRKSIREAEKNLFLSTFAQNRHDEILEAMNFYDEYKYKINDLINFLNKKEILKTRFERAIFNCKAGASHSGLIDITLIIKNMLEVDYEIIHIRQQLYFRILKIFRHLGKKNITKYLSIIDMENKDYLKTQKYIGNRSIYIWTKTFNRIENFILLKLLKSREMNIALISFSKNINKEKLKWFIDSARSEGISTHALISNNEWIFPKKRDDINKKIEEIKKIPFSGIHLDIEPHMFDDWKLKREKYFSLYENLLKFFREKIPLTYKLSVSVPLFQDIKQLKSIANVVDKLYIMSYGKNTNERVTKKIDKIFLQIKDKTVVSLRISDFINEHELEKFIAQIYKRNKVWGFALHDLGEIFIKGGLGLEINK